MRLSIDTDVVDRKDKLGFFMDFVCEQLLQVECRIHTSLTPLFASMTVVGMPDLLVSRVSVRGQVASIVRRPLDIARSGTDTETFTLLVQNSGHGVVWQDDREVFLEPGDCAIYHNERPFRLDFDGDFSQTVVQFGADVLRQSVKHLDRHAPQCLKCDAVETGLLRRMADALYESGDRLPARAAHGMLHALGETVAASLDADEAHGLSAYHMAKARDFILRHLDNPDLCVEMIAAAAGVSVSHLHRLFGVQKTGIMEWVWERRLDACRRALVDPRRMRESIASISYRCGFKDPSHFSRTFKANFGCAPGEYRRSARSDAGA